MRRALALLAVPLMLSCSGSQTRPETAQDDEDEGGTRPSFGSESAGEDVGRLTLERATAGLQNQGCMNIEVLSSAELAHPEGLALVMTAELCEGYEDDGQLAYLVSAVGNAYVMSNTVHPLTGVGGGRVSDVAVLSLEAPQPDRNGPSVVVLRYRTPPEGSEGPGWMERLVVGTFSADALDLAVTQPLTFDVRVGGGHLTGEGSSELVDADGDGDLDLRMVLSATGRGCGRGGACRNGEHRCEVTVPWARSGYEVELTGDDCLYLGRLEL